MQPTWQGARADAWMSEAAWESAEAARAPSAWHAASWTSPAWIQAAAGVPGGDASALPGFAMGRHLPVASQWARAAWEVEEGVLLSRGSAAGAPMQAWLSGNVATASALLSGATTASAALIA